MRDEGSSADGGRCRGLKLRGSEIGRRQSGLRRSAAATDVWSDRSRGEVGWVRKLSKVSIVLTSFHDVFKYFS